MIAKSEDGMRCAVAGRESLRILRLSEPDETQSSQHRPTVGRGGIETSRNLWEGSGLKVDSASTDVAWCSGAYNNKVLTSARSGELIMWDVCKSGSSKYGEHRSHPSVVMFIPFGMQRGRLRTTFGRSTNSHVPLLSPTTVSPVLQMATCEFGYGVLPSLNVNYASIPYAHKVWELSSSSTRSHILTKPTYTLHPAYPVRRVLWRPDYPCELALVSNAEFGACDLVASPRLQNTSTAFIAAITSSTEAKEKSNKNNVTGDSIEIWDVRRGWIAKWTVDTSILEGAVTDAVFHDSHALWAQHSSGTFAQIDLRSSTRPIDAVSRVALSWGASRGPDGTLMFVTDKRARHPDKRPLLSERKLKEKGLGDESRMPNKQSMGTYIRVQPSENVDYSTFSRLAKEYLIPDNLDQRKHVCAMNAKVYCNSSGHYPGDIHNISTS
ncbi:hypothetical protein ID866_8285 [Astraeus odoratus]|nr:hypothetical protein ID866_8285 [Astraeus odoratus]